jgi:hypothetical protein
MDEATLFAAFESFLQARNIRFHVNRAKRVLSMPGGRSDWQPVLWISLQSNKIKLLASSLQLNSRITPQEAALSLVFDSNITSFRGMLTYNCEKSTIEYRLEIYLWPNCTQEEVCNLMLKGLKVLCEDSTGLLVNSHGNTFKGPHRIREIRRISMDDLSNSSCIIVEDIIWIV